MTDEEKVSQVKAIEDAVAAAKAEAGQFSQQDIEDAVSKANGGLRGELTRERTSRQDFATKLEESQNSLKEIQDGIAAQEAAKEKEGLESEGKYREALEKVKGEFDEKLGGKDTKIQQQDKYIRGLLVDNAIMAAANNTVNPKEIVTLMTSTGMFKVAEKDGVYTVLALDENDVPLLDDDAKDASVEFAVNKYLSTRPHLVKAQTHGGAGSEGTGGSGGGNGELQKLNKQLEEVQKSDSPNRTAEVISLQRQIHEINLAAKT